MKVLIVSDTHGHDENLERAVMMETPFDMLVHCGMWRAVRFLSKLLWTAPAVLLPAIMTFFSDLPREED